MSTGVFQIDREIFKSSIWTSPAEFRLFFYLIGNAVWKEDGINCGGVHVKRGQFLRSYRNLREDLMYIENNALKYYSLSKIKRIVDKLVADKRIQISDTELGTLFTIVNYELYQGFNKLKGDKNILAWNSDGTATEQQRNNKKKDNKDNKDNYIYVVEQVIDYLNAKTGKSFKHTSKVTRSKINARLEEGFTLDDFKKVIDIKTSEWLNDANMQLYLRPETLFGNKFEGYLNQKAARGGQEIAGKDHNNFKNKFNNFEGQSSQYTEEELNAIALNAKKRRQQEDSK